ncbi:amidoligase enzyme [Bacteroides thetaiotaomicron]|uniref:Amidoligase enzyme n=1 Tax=Bacteroides thetaiotaomicron TaxID=818 RepID=A0A7J5JQD4_BACT4|nr:amidoligase family protein [Bacteroides thetaiotaomicron]KAB4416637.1 amidoligase enzyme [Bacteroides thetaiotaomicron]KAB4431729.1 amidoligase enzyme [Bacteroides thetaiotaomicron]KAB4438081.1 amidoligase enzyme [Bacteroides thetaiotaomicron]KAB4440851.1 amidoligase enzyme [Bacteroides thetaiotaomicron]KAB4453646.1 amidoligase enzyme [Bacteroides thetaiotaomicron]
MNEQIRNILAQDTTKTRKIQQLLLLGMTRREIADLLTNGNYGFVHNVYKRMLRDGLIENIWNSAIETRQPVRLDYTFTHKFGIEIEAYNCRMSRLAQELREAGIRVAVEGYNHTTRDHWKLVTDGSLQGNDTFELVSPILAGEAGLKELEKVCWVLDLCNVKVNDSCGLHVHLDAADFNMNTWRNLALSYKHLENLIDAFMPGTRRNNRYCKSLSHVSDERIKSAGTIDALRDVFNRDRYHKVNFEAYARHKTVEFRQHSGTTNFTKMENWILFLNGLITFAKQDNLSGRNTLDSLPFLDEKQKLYFKIRTKKLAR